MANYAELRQAAEAAWKPIAEPRRTLIRVGVGTCSRVVGAEATLTALRQAAAEGRIDADVVMTGCMGLCFAEPLVEVLKPGQPPVLYQQVTEDMVHDLISSAVAGRGASADMALAVAGEQALGSIPALTSLPFWQGQVRRLMANSGLIDPESIDHYIARGGYEGLSRALKLGAEAIIKEMSDSGLWGRGGAAFPTG